MKTIKRRQLTDLNLAVYCLYQVLSNHMTIHPSDPDSEMTTDELLLGCKDALKGMTFVDFKVREGVAELCERLISSV